MANNEKDMKNLFNQLDELLGASDIKDVSAESSGFAQLKNGYYLCEVKKAELKPSKSSGKLMAAFQLKVVEDGTDFTFDAKSRPTPVTLKGTKNRTIFKYFPFSDENSVRRFVADMLKFEGDEPGVPLLTKEYFTNSELIEDALEVLTCMNIYVHNDVSMKDDGTESAWVNFVSWADAAKLGLKV